MFDISSGKATKARDTLDIARSYNYICDCYETSKSNSAYYYYQRAEKLYRLKGNYEKVAKIMFLKVYMLYFEGNYLESDMLSDAMQLLKKAMIPSCFIPIIEKIGKLIAY